MGVRRQSSERRGGRMLSSRKARRRGVDASRWRGWARSLLGGRRKSFLVRVVFVLVELMGLMVGLGCSSKLSWCIGETP